MIVLDAYAVLALLKGEPAAVPVQALLDGDEPTRLTAVGAAEVLDHLVRIVGADEEEAVLDLAELGLLSPLAVDGALAMGAGLLRAHHYHRTRRPVSLADCVAAQATRPPSHRLATSDPHLLDLCHDEGISIEALPDTRGSMWTPA